MRKQNNCKLLILLLLMIAFSSEIIAQKLAIDKWHYIQVDSSRQKWGDWDKPDWLRQIRISQDNYIGMKILTCELHQTY